jgi:hypothetical protein
MGILDRFRRRRTPATSTGVDGLVLAQLAHAGADLTKARHVLHFLYFPDGASAQRAAAELDDAGYETSVAPPDEGVEQWALRAEATRVVGPDTVGAFRAHFERVAAEHGGEYDGWEAAAQP